MIVRMECDYKTVLLPWKRAYLPSELQAIAHKRFVGTGDAPVLVFIPDDYAERYLYQLPEFVPRCHSVTARAYGKHALGCIGSLVFVRQAE